MLSKAQISVVSSLVIGGACMRASEGELLAGKACDTSVDCVTGFVCDNAALVCVRAGTEDSAGGSSTLAGSGGAPAFGGSSGSSNDNGGSQNAGGDAGSGGSANGGAAQGGAAGGRGSAGNGSSSSCEASCFSCIGSTCISTWTPMSAAPSSLTARAQPAYATGSGKLLIWGGVGVDGVDLDTGAIYDPALDAWESMAVTSDTPSPRVLANAAWTGSQFMVWGGRSSSGATEYADGALYDPVAKQWTGIQHGSNARAAALTLGHLGQVLSSGGWSKDGAVLEQGERFNVVGNAWTSVTNDPVGKREHAGWAVSGSSLYVAGGRDDGGNVLSSGFVYQMGSNSWAAIPSLPAARYGSFVVRDNGRLWLWGGRDDARALGQGLWLDTAWAPMESEGEPNPRWAPQRQSGWSCRLGDERIAIVGGHDFAGSPLLDGGVYDAALDAWAPLPPALGAHDWGVGVCLDGQLLLWGGSTEGELSAAGERWSLASGF